MISACVRCCSSAHLFHSVFVVVVFVIVLQIAYCNHSTGAAYAALYIYYAAWIRQHNKHCFVTQIHCTLLALLPLFDYKCYSVAVLPFRSSTKTITHQHSRKIRTNKWQKKIWFICICHNSAPTESCILSAPVNRLLSLSIRRVCEFSHNIDSICLFFYFVRFLCSRNRYGSKIDGRNGGAKRNRKVYVWDCHISRNCLIVWAATAVYQWTLGCHPRYYQHYQVNTMNLFGCLLFFIELSMNMIYGARTWFFDLIQAEHFALSRWLFRSFLSGFLSHPQTVYPSYLTPPLSLTPANIAMSGLGLTHPQNMRLSSPQHPNGPGLSAQMLGHRHTPPNQMTLSPAILAAQSQSLPSIVPISSPQNLSTNSQVITGQRTNSNVRMLSPNSSASPENLSNLSNSNDKLMATTQLNQYDDSSETLNDLSVAATAAATNKDIGLNTDMRTNSIATLRIKAKEHLESINKGLAMA